MDICSNTKTRWWSITWHCWHWRLCYTLQYIHIYNKAYTTVWSSWHETSALASSSILIFSVHDTTCVIKAMVSEGIIVLFNLISNVLVNNNFITRKPLTPALCLYHLHWHSTNIGSLRAVLILSLPSFTKESALEPYSHELAADQMMVISIFFY